MDAVNVVLILIYAFAFFTEEEKKDSPTLVQYALVIPADDFHHSSNITMESSLNCDSGTIHVATNISTPSINEVTSTFGINSSSGFENVTTVENIPPQHVYLEISLLDVDIPHKRVYPEFPTLSITSPIELDREIWKPYLTVPVNPSHHGPYLRADIVYMFILVILVIGLMAGLASIAKHHNRINISIQKDIDDLRNEVTSTLQAMRDLKENIATKVKQNKILMSKIEDEKEGKTHAEQIAKALRSEFLNQYKTLDERLDKMEEKVHGSKKTMENTLERQALDMARVAEGVKYRKKLTEMSTQTKVYPKRTGILVQGCKSKMAQKKVDFWI